MRREETKQIRIGEVVIGGGRPILIQSMTNTRTEDVAATVRQILELEEAGCELIRCAVPTQEAARALREIKRQIHIPLIADIHFDYRLALAAMEYGADKIRINPGNIGSAERLAQVVQAAKERDIPIRVGVNSGSLEKELLARDGGVTAEGLADSALAQARLIERLGYDKLVISIKASDVPMTVRAHRLLAEKLRYPFHIGITETGPSAAGLIKSSVGLGILLDDGIGDTIRVSLTDAPVREIKAAQQILRVLHLREGGFTVVSCPTCGRTQIELIPLAKQTEALTERLAQEYRQRYGGRMLPSVKLAVMGCAVNGPGEAREADFGIAGGCGEGLLFAKGEVLRKVPQEQLLAALEAELRAALLPD